MPTFLELAVHMLMLGFLLNGAVLLRLTQPDPNPAIDAREAAAAAAELATALEAGLVCLLPPPPERRQEALPFVGQDRRQDSRQERLASDAAAWRNMA